MKGDAERAEPDPDDVDGQFAHIVAGYHLEAPDPIPPRTLPDVSAFSGLTPRAEPRDEPGLLEGLDTFGTDLPDAEDEDAHFVPPPPPPLPRPHKYTVIGVLSLLVGVTLLFWPEVLPIDSTVVMVAGFAAFVGGAGTLIWRLRPDSDSDSDDGARV